MPTAEWHCSHKVKHSLWLWHFLFSVLFNNAVSSQDNKALMIDEWMSMQHWWNKNDCRKLMHLEGKPVPVPLCPLQILHGLAWDQSWDSTVKGWWLNTSIITWLQCYWLLLVLNSESLLKRCRFKIPNKMNEPMTMALKDITGKVCRCRVIQTLMPMCHSGDSVRWTHYNDRQTHTGNVHIMFWFYLTYANVSVHIHHSRFDSKVKHFSISTLL
jgi:hypothetical protein